MTDPRRADLIALVRAAAPIVRPAAERIADAVLNWHERQPSPAADLPRDQRTDLIATAIENACECAAIDVTVREDDGTEAPLRRLARCLDGAGLIDYRGLQ